MAPTLFFLFFVLLHASLFVGSTHALRGLFGGDGESGATTTTARKATSTAATTAPVSTSTAVSPLGSATDVFVEGGACRASWLPAAKGSDTWKNMSIELMTGSNLEMSKLATVATGLDGTNATSYNYTCPSVSPNSAIYFLQYTHDGGLDPTWTTRFAIADAYGKTTAPANANQPEGGSPAIPWGQGQLVYAASPSATPAAAKPSAASQEEAQSPDESAMDEVYSSIFSGDSTRGRSSTIQMAQQDDAALSSLRSPAIALVLPALTFALLV